MFGQASDWAEPAQVPEMGVSREVGLRLWLWRLRIGTRVDRASGRVCDQ